MPTYRAIPDSEIAVDSALTQTTMQALKDNIEAVFEGDDTSPPIQMAAITRTTPTEGNNIILQLSELIGADDTSFLGFKVRLGGTYRITVESRLGDTPVQSDADRLGGNTLDITVQKINSGGTSTLFTHSDSVFTGGGHGSTVAVTTSDQTLAADDHVNLALDSGGDFPMGEVILTVSIDDDSAFWGAEVYGVL